jgi:hypothetical protein
MSVRRAKTLSVGAMSVSLPCFFPSISSVKMNLQQVDCLEFLVASGHPWFLVSAYNVANGGAAEHRVRMQYLLARAATANQVVMMDSGKYEAFWKADASCGVWSGFTKYAGLCTTILVSAITIRRLPVQRKQSLQM